MAPTSASAPTPSACCSTRLWANLWFDLAGAVAGGRAASGALVALFISHRRGIYYALLTIAFGQVFWFVAIKWHSVTGGEDGLLNIKRLPADFGFASISLKSNEALFYFCLARVRRGHRRRCGGWCIRRSAACFSAIKQNETRAAFVGYNVWLYKWLAFTISAGVAGLAGAHVRDGAAVGLPQRDEPAQLGLRGDDGADRRRLVSFWGPVIGAAFFILARDLLGAYTETWLLWYGLVFMALVLFKPEGVAGIWQAWRAARKPQARCAAGAGRAGAGEAGMRCCSKPRACPSASATRWCWKTSRLSFEEGQLAGIMGPNGAGKTTCFNVLTGRFKPDRGRVHFRRRGHHRAGAARDRAQGHLALVPDHEPVQRLHGAGQRADGHAPCAPAGLQCLARPGRRQHGAGPGRRRCWPAWA